MSLSPFSFVLLLGFATCFNAWAQQPPPTRTFEDMLRALPAQEVKEAARSGAKKEEKLASNKTFTNVLQANETGKKYTLQFVKGKKVNVLSPPDLGMFHNDHKASIVRVNDIKYYVDVEVSVKGQAMMAKADKFRDGQKIAVSGTIRHASLYLDAPMVGSGADAIQRPNMQVLSIMMDADEITLQK